MSFLKMVAKAKASGNHEGDFFRPNLTGEIEVERVFQHEGENGTSVIFLARVVACEAKKEGAIVHKPGDLVKKVYSISKYPKVAPGQLKGDLLAIDGLKEDELSAADIEGMLGAVFEDAESPMFELRGYRTKFNTRVIDRSKDKKENLTGVNFTHLENKPEEMAERKKAIDARLAAAK